MATKKTTSTKKAATSSAKNKAKPAAKKVAPKPKVKTKPAPVKALPRHPMVRVVESHGSKAALASAVAKAIARADQDAGALETQLKKASNAQLLRLQRATQTLKEKFGDREKLIAAIGTATNKSKDKDYLAKLDTLSLPHLLDLAAASQRSART